jgi:thymidylate kinase
MPDSAYKQTASRLESDAARMPKPSDLPKPLAVVYSRTMKSKEENKNSGLPCLVSFSGIDGAGKTTQIDALLTWLRASGFRTRVLRFWDDIAVLGRLRETASHKLFKSEQGVGAMGKPVERRDKNVRGWYMTLARLFLYFLDAAQLFLVIAKQSRKEVDVVVFDRYLYDELANLNLKSRLAGWYARLLLWMVPRPDAAFVLDADPEQARARKPEYPVEFLKVNRAAYRDVVHLSPGITVVPPLTAEDASRFVLRQVNALLFSEDHITRCSIERTPRIDQQIQPHQ